MTDPIMVEFKLVKIRPRFYKWTPWWPFRLALTVTWTALNGRHGCTHKLFVGDTLEIANPNMIIDPTPVDCNCDICRRRNYGT